MSVMHIGVGLALLILEQEAMRGLECGMSNRAGPASFMYIGDNNLWTRLAGAAGHKTKTYG